MKFIAVGLVWVLLALQDDGVVCKRDQYVLWPDDDTKVIKDPISFSTWMNGVMATVTILHVETCNEYQFNRTNCDQGMNCFVVNIGLLMEQPSVNARINRPQNRYSLCVWPDDNVIKDPIRFSSAMNGFFATVTIWHVGTCNEFFTNHTHCDQGMNCFTVDTGFLLVQPNVSKVASVHRLNDRSALCV